jgi:hypothetical protein
MAVAGGFRLAFWSEDARHHGPRLDRALARYARYADARPAGFPAAPVAAFARFLAEHTPRQNGPEHGMAYDVQRFNELTKQMSAYAHYTRDGHLQLAAARVRRRDRARQLADQLNSQLRLRFRTGDDRPSGRLRLASELLDSDCPAHQAAGKRSTRPPSRRSGSSSATSGCRPGSTPVTRTAATAPPAPTPSGGASKCHRDGGRRASRRPESTREQPAQASPRRARR